MAPWPRTFWNMFIVRYPATVHALAAIGTDVSRIAFRAPSCYIVTNTSSSFARSIDQGSDSIKLLKNVTKAICPLRTVSINLPQEHPQVQSRMFHQSCRHLHETSNHRLHFLGASLSRYQIPDP